MCFTTPVPLAKLYPWITNWCDPFVVCVTDLELVGDSIRSGFVLGLDDQLVLVIGLEIRRDF
ncbi:unnamed protein product [Arabidopsis arenosa]|uniref:Uncharacterized protein n=1 Tax=Arabidopsis arenosa TaxID=38785 RepID=A0A8S2AEF9_ARAAE|nr:unnamed protein product [Arabidopsis arenosa]